MEDERLPFEVLSIGVLIGSNDDVGVAVAIHIACGPHGLPELRKGLIAIHRPRRGLLQPIRRAVIHERHSLMGLAVVISHGAHNHIRVPIPIHVPRRPYRVPKRAQQLSARPRPIGPVAEAHVGSVEHVGAPIIGPVRGSADDEIRISISVHVPRRADVPAEVLFETSSPRFTPCGSRL
jgi:hypothetical protein